MVVLFISVLFFLAVALYFTNNKKIHILIFVIVWWLFWTLINSFNIFKLDKPTDKSYLLMILCMIALMAFPLIYNIFFEKPSSMVEITENFSLKLLIILELVVLILLIPNVIKAINVILTNGLTYQRYIISNPQISNTNLNTVERILILHLGATPFIFTCALINFYILVKSKKTINLSTTICCLDILAISIITAGRSLIFNVLVYCTIIFILLMLEENLKIKHYNKREVNRSILKYMDTKINKGKYVIIVSIFTSILLLISKNRVYGKNILENIIIYFTGSYSMFAKGIEYTIAKSFNGSATFAGIFSIIYYCLLPLNITMYNPEHLINDIIQSSVPISVEYNFNAFYSMFYYFYLDFKGYGIILIPFLIGVIWTVIYSKYIKNKKMINLISFTLITAIFITGIYTWELYKPEWWMSNFYLIILNKIIVLKTDKNNSNNFKNSSI